MSKWAKFPKNVCEQTQFKHGNASVKNPCVVSLAMEFSAQGRGQETNTDSNYSCAQGSLFSHGPMTTSLKLQEPSVPLMGREGQKEAGGKFSRIHGGSTKLSTGPHVSPSMRFAWIGRSTLRIFTNQRLLPEQSPNIAFNKIWNF